MSSDVTETSISARLARYAAFTLLREPLTAKPKMFTQVENHNSSSYCRTAGRRNSSSIRCAGKAGVKIPRLITETGR